MGVAQGTFATCPSSSSGALQDRSAEHRSGVRDASLRRTRSDEPSGAHSDGTEPPHLQGRRVLILAVSLLVVLAAADLKTDGLSENELETLVYAKHWLDPTFI